MKLKACLFFIFFWLPGLLRADGLSDNFTPLKTSRLIVAIDPEASFSMEEFSTSTSALSLNIDARNPYKAFQNVFLNESFIVIPFVFSEERSLRKVASRFGYRYVIFKNESLQEAINLTQNLLQQIPKHSSQLQALSVPEANKLYSLMENIHKVFTSLNIKYWVGRETLHGAICHGGLMPWDDYLYLYILDTDEKKLGEASSAFDEIGIELHSYFKDIYKISPKDGSPLYDEKNTEMTLPFRYPAANIFIMTLEKKGDLSRNEVTDTYVHKSDDFYAHWHHDRFDYYQIENIFRANFGPVIISVPGDPEAYLNRVFGAPSYPDLWKRYTFERPWDHRFEKLPSYPGTALVEIDDFSPAPWLE